MADETLKDYTVEDKVCLYTALVLLESGEAEDEKDMLIKSLDMLSQKLEGINDCTVVSLGG